MSQPEEKTKKNCRNSYFNNPVHNSDFLGGGAGRRRQACCAGGPVPGEVKQQKPYA